MKRPSKKAEQVRFYILLVLLALSIALAWLIQTGLTDTLPAQFS